MKRKVVKQGHNAMTITLPSKWTQLNDIKAGDELEVTNKQNSLIILPKYSHPSDKKIIDATNMTKRIANYAITTAYNKGYDEVEILCDNKEMIDYLSKIVNEALLGYEIFFKSDKKCIIKNISSTQASEFEALMKKNFEVVSMLADESLEFIKNKKYKELLGLIELETTNNKFTNYLLRTIIVEGIRSHYNDFLLYTLVLALERIPDTYKEICKYLASQNPKQIKISRETFKIYEELNNIIKNYIKLYSSYNPTQVNDLSLKWGELLNETRMATKNSKNIHEITVLNCLVRIIHQMDILLYQLVGYMS